MQYIHTVLGLCCIGIYTAYIILKCNPEKNEPKTFFFFIFVNYADEMHEYFCIKFLFLGLALNCIFINVRNCLFVYSILFFLFFKLKLRVDIYIKKITQHHSPFLSL